MSGEQNATRSRPVEVLILAVPETAGSALYGMLDVLLAAGNIWQSLVRASEQQHLFNVRIVSLDSQPFFCGNRIPINPDCAIDEQLEADIIILPELWLGPDENIRDRYPQLMQWIREQYHKGRYLYSACSGAVMLAESGLLNGCPATSHWGYQDLFHKQYPQVKFEPVPNLVFADPAGRIVTAGGTSSWHDLAMHIISRHASAGEAVRIARVYLLKWHSEGQLPYASLIRSAPHADSVVRKCEDWLKENYRSSQVIPQVLVHSGVPERSLKRRFKAATGSTLIEYVQNLRIEQARCLLETGVQSVEDISVEVSYEDVSFFRRLFKRLTGLSPSQYRRMFKPIEIKT